MLTAPLPARQSQTLSGDSLIIISMMLFGSYPLFLRLLPQLSPLTFLAAFQLVGAICFAVVVWRQGLTRLTKREYGLLFALAVAALLNDLCYFFAFTLTSVANAAVAHQSVSIFLLLLAPWLLHERTSRREWVGLAVSLAGVVVLFSNQLGASNINLFGIGLAVLSGFFYACIIVLYRTIPNPQTGRTISLVNFWRYSFSCVLLLPLLPWMGIQTLTSTDLVPLAGFAILFAVIASGIHTYGVSRTRSLHASILGKSEPVFAILYAAVILHEQPTSNAIIGGCLIIGASIWLAAEQANKASGAKK